MNKSPFELAVEVIKFYADKKSWSSLRISDESTNYQVIDWSDCDDPHKEDGHGGKKAREFLKEFEHVLEGHKK